MVAKLVSLILNKLIIKTENNNYRKKQVHSFVAITNNLAIFLDRQTWDLA